MTLSLPFLNTPQELRTKLDWTRENGNRRVQRAEKTAKELRMKFALAGGASLLGTTCMSTLVSISLPPINTPSRSATINT